MANSIRDSFSECGTWSFIDYIRGLFTVLYFIFGCVPHFDLACYINIPECGGGRRQKNLGCVLFNFYRISLLF